MYMIKTTEQIQKELNLKIDLGMGLAKAEGNLKHLARESNSSNWKGTFTQAETIMDALHAVQEAREALKAMRDLNNSKKI